MEELCNGVAETLFVSVHPSNFKKAVGIALNAEFTLNHLIAVLVGIIRVNLTGSSP